MRILAQLQPRAQPALRGTPIAEQARLQGEDGKRGDEGETRATRCSALSAVVAVVLVVAGLA
jgi:hypothetical protein